MTGWRAVGDTGWLADLGSTGDHVSDAHRVLAVARVVRAVADPRVIDVVPAARTVLVSTTPDHHRALGAALARIDPVHESVTGTTDVGNPPTAPRIVRVRFDGEDLAAVAAAAGHSIKQLVERLVAATWTAAFVGFAPGFAYLVGGGLDVPRLPSPRARVPPGSLGLAGPYAGVYPRASPGGWRLVGSVVAAPALFDPDREPAALIAPGDGVRFVPAP